MNHADVKLTPMTDEMYHSYFREYENDPDLYLPGQEYVHYVYSEEKAERYIQRQRDLGRVTLAILYGDEIAGEIIIRNIEEHRCATMGIPVLFADTVKTNTRSRHVLEKVGFAFLREGEDFIYYRIDRGQENCSWST